MALLEHDRHEASSELTTNTKEDLIMIMARDEVGQQDTLDWSYEEALEKAGYSTTHSMLFSL